MSQHRRHQEIVKWVIQHGYANIDDLAQHFSVTPQTIRRDLNSLANNGEIVRYHGGAVSQTSTQNTAYHARQIMQLNEKKRIAKQLVTYIPNHASLFINIGTTTETIAKALLKHHGLKIITNNIHVASLFCNKTDFEVILAGGQLRQPDGGIVGQATVEFIQQFKVDFGIIGISGIDADGALLDFDYQEVKVSQAIINNSRAVFLAADQSKFGRNAVVRLGHVTQVSKVFTDYCPFPKLKQRLADCKVELIEC
ncbi:DeoR family transcriptional regulator [Spartinivicinus poritis]|uniref:DeoR family transcriptional regulator n=1 Tax=Spartinivicinus poritis TaxID=2994640 RepID=A0ABT5U6U6_9GAMM|nr:DeoR family transcriptional regulator [Spartinivicinus sp. A2-2]MDE1462086.1 DeoR family transcriptional regulator [Spartinivicinus sp. A2-2]